MPVPDRSFFDAVYEGHAPWDVGDAQPDLLALLEEVPPTGPILDLGCGTGDLVIALARRGHRVIGIDFAAAAIDEARARAAALSDEEQASIRLELADALQPSAYAGSIGSVVDSGFYHLFEEPQRRALAGELRAALPPLGRYYMLGFAIEIPSADAPRRVAAEEITHIFTPEAGWSVLAARLARFVTKGFGDIPALAVCVQRKR